MSCPTDGRYIRFAYDRKSEKPCGCGNYCVQQAHAEFYEKEFAKLQHQWPDGWSVAKETIIQLSNVQIVLQPNGTYHLCDTSGG